MTNFRWFASFVLAATMASALQAETQCPGNVESVPLRLVNGYQMIVAVYCQSLRSLRLSPRYRHCRSRSSVPLWLPNFI